MHVLQGEGQQSDETVILREAVYRGLGEALMQMEPLMPFQQWWGGELRQLIVACLQVLGHTLFKLLLFCHDTEQDAQSRRGRNGCKRRGSDKFELRLIVMIVGFLPESR